MSDLKKDEEEPKMVTRARNLSLRITQQDRDVLRLYSRGKTPAEIRNILAAKGQKMTIQNIQNVRKKCLAKMQAETDDASDSLRYQELDRIEMAREKLAPMVENGDLQAMDRWFKAGESVRKLLNLDKAPKLMEGIMGPEVGGDYAMALVGVMRRVDQWTPPEDPATILEHLQQLTEGEDQEKDEEDEDREESVLPVYPKEPRQLDLFPGLTPRGAKDE